MEAPSVYQTPLQAPPYGPDKQYEYNVSCHLDEIFTSSTQKSLNRGILHGLATPATFPHWRNQDITSVPGFTGKQIPQTEPFDYSRPSWLASVAAEMPTIAMFANSDPEVTTEEFFKEPSPFPKIDKRTQPNNLNVAIFQPMIPAPPGDVCSLPLLSHRFDIFADLRSRSPLEWDVFRSLAAQVVVRSLVRALIPVALQA